MYNLRSKSKEQQEEDNKFQLQVQNSSIRGRVRPLHYLPVAHTPIFRPTATVATTSIFRLNHPLYNTPAKTETWTLPKPTRPLTSSPFESRFSNYPLSPNHSPIVNHSQSSIFSHHLLSFASTIPAELDHSTRRANLSLETSHKIQTHSQKPLLAITDKPHNAGHTSYSNHLSEGDRTTNQPQLTTQSPRSTVTEASGPSPLQATTNHQNLTAQLSPNTNAGHETSSDSQIEDQETPSPHPRQEDDHLDHSNHNTQNSSDVVENHSAVNIDGTEQLQVPQDNLNTEQLTTIARQYSDNVSFNENNRLPPQQVNHTSVAANNSVLEQLNQSDFHLHYSGENTLPPTTSNSAIQSNLPTFQHCENTPLNNPSNRTDHTLNPIRVTANDNNISTDDSYFSELAEIHSQVHCTAFQPITTVFPLRDYLSPPLNTNSQTIPSRNPQQQSHRDDFALRNSSTSSNQNKINSTSTKTPQVQLSSTPRLVASNPTQITTGNQPVDQSEPQRNNPPTQFNLNNPSFLDNYSILHNSAPAYQEQQSSFSENSSPQMAQSTQNYTQFQPVPQNTQTRNNGTTTLFNIAQNGTIPQFPAHNHTFTPTTQQSYFPSYTNYVNPNTSRFSGNNIPPVNSNICSHQIIPPTVIPAAVQQTTTNIPVPANDIMATDKICFLGNLNPSKYSGARTSDPIKWSSSFKEFVTFNGWSDQQATRAIPLYLSCKAKGWWDQLSQSIKDQGLHAILEALITHFNDKGIKYVFDTQFAEIKQKQGESVEDYSDRLDRLAARTKKSDQQKLTVFMSGLLPKLKVQVIPKQPDDYSSAVSFASLLESFNLDDGSTKTEDPVPVKSTTVPDTETIAMAITQSLANQNKSNNLPVVICQICNKRNHVAPNCRLLQMSLPQWAPQSGVQNTRPPASNGNNYNRTPQNNQYNQTGTNFSNFNSRPYNPRMPYVPGNSNNHQGNYNPRKFQGQQNFQANPGNKQQNRNGNYNRSRDSRNSNFSNQQQNNTNHYQSLNNPQNPPQGNNQQ